MAKKVVTAELCKRYTELVGTKSYKDIAAELGVSKTAVFKMSEITGVKPTERQKTYLCRQAHQELINRELESKIVAMWDDNSTRKIASELGVTRSAVIYHANRIGLKRTKEKQSELLSKAVSTLNKRIRRNLNFGIRISSKNLSLNPKLSIQKQKIRAYLRTLGYSIEEASNEIYVLSTTERKRCIEKNAKKLGFRIIVQSNIWSASKVTIYDLIQRYVNTVSDQFSIEDVMSFIRSNGFSCREVSVCDYLRCMVVAGYLSKHHSVYERIKEIPYETTAADLRRIRSNKAC